MPVSVLRGRTGSGRERREDHGQSAEPEGPREARARRGGTEARKDHGWDQGDGKDGKRHRRPSEDRKVERGREGRRREDRTGTEAPPEHCLRRAHASVLPASRETLAADGSSLPTP